MVTIIKRTDRMPSARYGIAEWFGKEMIKLTPVERQQFGRAASRQMAAGETARVPQCPFLSTLIPEAKCNKAGGVCSIRQYSKAGEIVAGGQVATVCPSRFLQSVDTDRSLFSWIAEKMLDIAQPIIVKETPFLRKVVGSVALAPGSSTGAIKDAEKEAAEEEKKAGRIDWILVNPATLSSGDLEWCAVETQALYFSGKGMKAEFEAYALAPSGVLFPLEYRRPDYRSSGPKRLWPQLDVKVPVLRNWGKKVVVVVDRFFYKNMNKLIDPFPKAKSDKERRENADVAWFIVDYDNQMRLTAGDVLFTTLESSRTALNATEPLSKSDFTNNLRRVIADDKKKSKVFTTSR